MSVIDRPATTLDRIVSEIIANGDAPSSDTSVKTGQPVPTVKSFSFESKENAELVSNLLADDPTAAIVPAEYGATHKRRSALSVLFSVANGSDWTPIRNADATFPVTHGKATEYDAMLADACAIRGGTVVAVKFGYKLDSMGFRIHNPAPVRRELVNAFTRMSFEYRKRMDIGAMLIMANDTNADDIGTVSGYFLLKIQGYRVK